MIRVIRAFVSLRFYNIGWQLSVITVTCTGGPRPPIFYRTFFAEEVKNSKFYFIFLKKLHLLALRLHSQKRAR